MTAWMADAACRHPEADPETFFPTHPRHVVAALAWCRACPVTADCLGYAVSTPLIEGVWGGRLFVGRRPKVGAP